MTKEAITSITPLQLVTRKGQSLLSPELHQHMLLLSNILELKNTENTPVIRFDDMPNPLAAATGQELKETCVTKAELKRFIHTSDITESHSLFRLVVNSARLNDRPDMVTAPGVLFDYQQFLDFESRKVDNTPRYFPEENLRKPNPGPLTNAVMAGTACIMVRLPCEPRYSYHTVAYATFGMARQCKDIAEADSLPIHLVRMEPCSIRNRGVSGKYKPAPRDPAIANTIIRTFQTAIDNVRIWKGLPPRKILFVESCLPLEGQAMTETSGIHAIFSLHCANRCREDLLPHLDAFAIHGDDAQLWSQADRILHRVTSWGRESKLPTIYAGPSTRFFKDISATKMIYASSWDLILLEFVIHIVISYILEGGVALKTRKLDLYEVILTARQQALDSFSEGVTWYPQLVVSGTRLLDVSIPSSDTESKLNQVLDFDHMFSSFDYVARLKFVRLFVQRFEYIFRIGHAPTLEGTLKCFLDSHLRLVIEREGEALWMALFLSICCVSVQLLGMEANVEFGESMDATVSLPSMCEGALICLRVADWSLDLECAIQACILLGPYLRHRGRFDEHAELISRAIQIARDFGMDTLPGEPLGATTSQVIEAVYDVRFRSAVKRHTSRFLWCSLCELGVMYGAFVDRPTMDLPELHKDLLPSNINDRDVHEGLLYIPLIPASKYTDATFFRLRMELVSHLRDMLQYVQIDSNGLDDATKTRFFTRYMSTIGSIGTIGQRMLRRENISAEQQQRIALERRMSHIMRHHFMAFTSASGTEKDPLSETLGIMLDKSIAAIVNDIEGTPSTIPKNLLFLPVSNGREWTKNEVARWLYTGAA